jgi:copper transport protein
MRLARHVRPLALALGLGVVLVALAWGPLGPLARGIPTASAHALLVRSNPAADAVLSAPPAQVQMWFSEDLNTLTSRAVVVDTANRQVDRNDSHVNDDNPREMDVSLPLLPAGTYVVTWRTQSAEDGHIVGGSFIFRIKRPDGSVPPIPATLPTGHVPGAGGSGASPDAPLDGPTIFQAISTWLALLFMTFWVGGVIWQTWILSPGLARDPDLRAAAEAAALRFRRLAPYALVLMIVADFGLVLGLSAELAGQWSGAFSPLLLHAILLGSRFGAFWWMRQIIATFALVLAALSSLHGLPAWRASALTPARARIDGAIPSWRRELVSTLLDVRTLPARIVRGWRGRSWAGRAECVLGAALLLAFALSGHAAAVSANELAYAVSVDMLHLLGNAVWIGGLLYISVVFVPSLRMLSQRSWARVLALGLPEFSAVALVSATVLAATGTLNTTIHLTSITQFLTTTYGRTLAVKIEFFLVMIGISAFHAFVLRPRLAYALAHDVAAPAVAVDSAASAPAREVLARASGASRPPAASSEPPSSRANEPGTAAARMPADAISGGAQRLAERIEDWLRREAMIGVVILFCVALLAAFAGSLSPATSAAPATTTTAAAPFVQTEQASGLAITLNITPATFGTNTFTVTVKDAQGKPVQGAAVLVQTIMLDMDMGVQNVQLKASGASSPGVYSGQSDLTMAGHWDVLVKVLPPQGKQFVQADFRLSATY